MRPGSSFMPVRRKVFRIEQMGPIGTPSAALADGMSARQQQEILAELKAMRELMERRPPAPAADARESAALRELKIDAEAIQRALTRTKQEIAAMHAAAFGGAGEAGAARVTRELDAIADSAERATQRILDAAEDIEDAANTLSASLKNGQEQALALDIQDHVLRIFEACNFQDLAGQRIAKVLATLKFIEERIAHMMEIWGGLDAFRDLTGATPAARDRNVALHGPKLDGDEGHISQDDIDIMFATG
jgi:chemotaxis protein CheZ